MVLIGLKIENDIAGIDSLTQALAAIDHFNVNRIPGRGGQGTVYKRMLTDGGIIAEMRLRIATDVVEALVFLHSSA
ncbi:hypothetical protein CUMW_265200 [Citrus unshiu]|uniref:Protein kinase domain-containing protein n=1 Tax=Citrus unshiu TaxID=55188 RepID=A0A2H5QVC5_CITUN|nr:hypothetical protein CUMW_265200 [Citrus unshiu]